MTTGVTDINLTEVDTGISGMNGIDFSVIIACN